MSGPTSTDVQNVPGNYYDKYNATNPIAGRLVANFLKSFVELAESTQANEVFEVGCGEGNLSLKLLRKGWTVRGADLEESVVNEANESAEAEGFGAPFFVADVYSLTPSEISAPVIVCCEVLEHLPDPERAVDLLAEAAQPWVLLSVPREPIWRILNVARGKYFRHLGNTPGHIQHWSRRSFLAMVSRRLDVISVRSPLPWTMVLCRTR